jgi:geranylgeranyl pyrophosphate synthase
MSPTTTTTTPASPDAPAAPSAPDADFAAAAEDTEPAAPIDAPASDATPRSETPAPATTPAARAHVAEQPAVDAPDTAEAPLSDLADEVTEPAALIDAPPSDAPTPSEPPTPASTPAAHTGVADRPATHAPATADLPAPPTPEADEVTAPADVTDHAITTGAAGPETAVVTAGHVAVRALDHAEPAASAPAEQSLPLTDVAASVDGRALAEEAEQVVVTGSSPDNESTAGAPVTFAEADPGPAGHLGDPTAPSDTTALVAGAGADGGAAAPTTTDAVATDVLAAPGLVAEPVAADVSPAGEGARVAAPVVEGAGVLAGVGLEEELGRQLGLVEAALVSSVVEGDAGLAEAFDQALTRDRWRLRARLVLLGAAAVRDGPPPPSVFAGAAAVELLHLAQVHHDREAALVGDHLLARAAQLGMAADAETGEAVARCAVDHVRGQLLDLRDRYDTGRTLGAYTEAAHARTATLTATATAMGGRLAGGTEPQVAALRSYGEGLGLALQLADDLHEVVADTTVDGQPTGEHLRTGVYTLPTLVAIHEAGELLAVLGRPLDRPALTHATQVVRRSEGIAVALTRIHAHVTEATAALAALDPGPVTAGLTELVHAIGKRAWSSVEAQPLVDLPR